ncbi:DUF3298 domain-containing protein [Bacillus safensis]|uniref:DUF3298 and DUF4163 domain-containing protein n=1 Tax=Bacillus safensis TaxID=561879 RepID=UPI002280E4C2|nr:DUF3298 and DUF4163 domain-containing protein [Bacillus safensis]MCY7565496.1 DUF3298 and DUF4163 domain-containing protein [Bacillus safensis]MCY7634322.1 DUF3298 and DUF4163 domain-containing protein [Bacillus safensis]MCY7652743.1 DUF3298 and DUF4163 domain-containing protein [Bacillus safensis]MCY7661762.1 DUF3298 and DUF4163 domain-containing protein [Bacillus safensis]MCY7664201.1 DUF3298 and DUF4163 domain-containing protein [Bacillus safensis]
MDKYLEHLKDEYLEIPIPPEYDAMVERTLKRKNKKPHFQQWTIGLVAAAALFVTTVNVSLQAARAISEVPVIGELVKVVTFTEFKKSDQGTNIDLKTPHVSGLGDGSLQDSLNQKYLAENKKLYQDFEKETKGYKNGHLSVESGYEVKTNNDQILSLGRYKVMTQGSSAEERMYDTVDKKNHVLITLPSLFKDDRYIDVISENIKEQMKKQMKEDSNKIYWIGKEETDPFKKIKPDQNFYINSKGKLVISFNEYDVAPGYMGVVEFTIPTSVLKDILVSDTYIH